MHNALRACSVHAAHVHGGMHSSTHSCRRMANRVTTPQLALRLYEQLQDGPYMHHWSILPRIYLLTFGTGDRVGNC